MSQNEYHSFDLKNGYGLPHDPLNSLVGPRPIGWISSQGSDGSINLAPYSFFNAFNYKPPIIGFCSTGPKNTLRNIQETGEFVWNLVTRPLVEKMNQTSAPVPYGTDEFELVGLAKTPSMLVKPPRVSESLVSLECKLTQILQLKTKEGNDVTSWLILGEVIAGHIHHSTLKQGIFDTFSAGVVLRAGGPTAYSEVLPETRFDLHRPT
ncbi:flavin reductase family protein [Bdellovibrio sp. HCB209]|uniref:flavin reductase family protein n=1 Tax=Bdellovibrio sp. HCB209 TaxID=3394354 RepID=UPI0039B39A3A